MSQNHFWNNHERWSEVAIFLLLVLNYAYFFPRWADPNQNSRLNMVFAVVDQGTFQIDRYVENTVDYAKVGAHYYSDKAPGTAFLGIPLYAGLKWALESPALLPFMDRLAHNPAFQATLKTGGTGIYLEKVRFAIAQVVLTFVISVLPSAYLGVLLLRALRKLTRGVQKLPAGLLEGTVLVYALLTPAFAYSGAFYGHQLTTAILFLTFWILFRSRGEKRLSSAQFAGIGFLWGFSIITEYPTALVAAVLWIYLVITAVQQGQENLHWLLWNGAGGALPVLGWMAYNTAVFGGPLNLGYNYSEQWQTQHHTGFMSLTVPHLDAIWGLTFGAFRGLFFLSPILLLAIPCFVAWWQSQHFRTELWIALACLAVTFAFNASSSMWWGGFAVGPRYLLPALPYLCLGVGFGVERWGKLRWAQAAVILLGLWSWIAIWGLTLAGQAFPSDALHHPLREYALPNWRAGNIARNWGTLLGLHGIWSLFPLGVAGFGILLVGWLGKRRLAGWSDTVQSEPH